MRTDPNAELVPVGTPIDLDNCAREPIHIPGSVQPRGVLAVVREPEFTVREVSANVDVVLGHPVEDVLGRHLSALIGAANAAAVEQVASVFGDLRQRNPLECVVDVAGRQRAFDAILHREPGGVLLVELEIAHGERPFSFPNTYQAVRDSVEELNRAVTLASCTTSLRARSETSLVSTASWSTDTTRTTTGKSSPSPSETTSIPFSDFTTRRPTSRPKPERCTRETG